MNKPKAIIFDYGGVLSIERSIRFFGEKYAPRFGKNAKKLNKIIIDNWLKARVNKMDSKFFCIKLSEYLEVEPKIIRKDFMDFFGFNFEVFNLVKKLDNSGYKLGLLSNFIEDLIEEIISNHRLDKIFDVIVTSHKSKVAKPAVSIFKEIVTKLNVVPNECIFIDDRKNNISAAKKLGFKTILFKDYTSLKKQLIHFGVKID
jgi:epoxide hydrolase-like predicted phosphatase